MARRTGWRLRKRGDTYSVRFRVGSERFEIATGARDLVGATRRAEAIYADAIAGRLKERTRFRLAADTPLEEVAALWLADMEAEVDAETVGLWKSYVRAHWRQHFGRLVDLTESNMAAYGRARLRAVLAVTARKELSALRRFVRWLAEQEHVSAPPVVPSLAKGAIGTRFEKRRRGQPTEISAEEARAIVAALPERSRKHGHIVRARFVVAYETALRPATLDALSVPEHYRRGADALRIAAEIDKARYGRQVPLSPAARAALDAVCPERGLLFGRHDHRDQLERAARRVLDETRAATFTAYDLRHCRLTELAETGNVTGAAYLAGHRRVGAAVLSVAPSQAAITAALPLPVEPDQRAELGRFVLLDDVPANGESWFLARCWELAREADIVAIVAHSDPVARLRADGTRVFPGHIGTIYQATNARYVGLTPRRSQRLFGDGTVLSARAISKLRVRERGWRYALESLVAHGAPEPSGDWRDWCRIAIESTTRVVRHSGNHRYVWALDRALRRHLPERRAYPKAETWRTAA